MIKYKKLQDNKKFSLRENFTFLLKEVSSCDRKLAFYLILPIIPHVLSDFLGAALPAVVVQGLEEKWELGKLLFVIFSIGVITLIINVFFRSSQVYVKRNSMVLGKYFGAKCMKKSMELDYEILEDSDTQYLIGNAWHAFQGTGISMAIPNLSDLLLCMLGVFFNGVIVGRKNIYIIIIMVISLSFSLTFLNYVRKVHAKYHVKLSVYSKETNYISRKTMDPGAGKDIRIYNMSNWLLHKQEEAVKGMDSIFGIIHNWYFLRSVSDSILAFIKDGVAWLYLIYLFFEGRVSASEFVLYIGLINGFSIYFEKLLRALLNITPNNTSIGYVHEFLTLENIRGKGKTEAETADISNAPCIELKDVTFRYSDCEKDILKDINLVIRPGEKLALLGLNGAGKTTLVKLICNLYTPTSGVILYNGKDIREYDRKEYYKFVSVLFQDNTIWPMTVDENIMLRSIKEKSTAEKKKLNRVLKDADFYEKYMSLGKKGCEVLVKEVNPEAIDFSGGEKQRMLFAKTLFKNTSLVILDEPTSAFDPLAEEKMYHNLSKGCRDKTTIFISHRLSSTSFCDRIVLLENGTIVEEGTHEVLMQKNGRYKDLYDRQSQYYILENQKKEQSEAFGEEYIKDDCEEYTQ